LAPLRADDADRLYRRGEEVFRPLASSVRHVAAEPEAARAWLRTLPFSLRGRVLVAWNRTLALSLPWHNFIAHWDDFCYPSSDDLFAFPEVGSGALAWNHEEIFEFVENAV
jgi:hypothetical protein